MTIGVQKPFIDYTQVGGDTGQNNSDSVLPYENGEILNQTVLDRPIEQLRLRTERIRDVLDDALYLRDADRHLLLAGPGQVTWPGAAPGNTGIPVLSDNLFIIPFLTPGASGNTPPIASSFGSLTLNKAGGAAGITVTSRRRNYEGGHKFNVTVVSGSPTSVVLQGSPPRNVVVTAAAGTILDTVVNAINALVDEQGTQALTAALAGGAGAGDLLAIPQAQQYVQGNWDAEGHVLTPANVASFFATSGNALKEGDTLAVWYAALTEDPAHASTLGPLGGRRQSIPENSNTTVPAGSLFNSRLHPERLTNALPIAKVINGSLVLINGTRIAAGDVSAVGTDLSDTTVDGPALIHALAAGVYMTAGTLRAQLNQLDTALAALSGGAADNWADGTTNPTPSVAKIIHDLANASSEGAAKIRALATGNFLTAGTVRSQLDELDAAIPNSGTTLSIWKIIANTGLITHYMTMQTDWVADAGFKNSTNLISLYNSIKAWGIFFIANGGAFSSVDGMNCGTPTVGSGLVHITFPTAMHDGNYATFVCVNSERLGTGFAVNQTLNGFDIGVYGSSGAYAMDATAGGWWISWFVLGRGV